jgi:hypothetical protein
MCLFIGTRDVKFTFCMVTTIITLNLPMKQNVAIKSPACMCVAIFAVLFLYGVTRMVDR